MDECAAQIDAETCAGGTMLFQTQDSLAEWSKALAPGASPQRRGFEPHSCHSLCATRQHEAKNVAIKNCNAVNGKTVWPRGLRRWLKAPGRKGVGSNPTAVTFATHLQATWRHHMR